MFCGLDGGDGGRGGDVVLEADPNLTTLIDLRYQKVYQAENGKPGRGQQMTGKSGKTLLIFQSQLKRLLKLVKRGLVDFKRS